MTEDELTKVKNLSDLLDVNIKQSVDRNVKRTEDSNLAALYLLKNIEKIKYILSGYKMVERHKVVMTHLNNLFPGFNAKPVDKILRKNGIYKFNYFAHLPLLMMVYVILQYIYIGYPVRDDFYKLLFLFVVHLVLLIGLMVIPSVIERTYIKTYRLSKEYKGLSRPTDIKW